MSKPTARPPPGRGPGIEGRPSGDSLTEFMPTLEESALIFSEEEAAKRRPEESRVAAARAVMQGSDPEQVPPNSPWAKAAAEKPIDKSALPSASAPTMDTPGAVAPVTAPIKAPEGRRKGWRWPPWAFPVAAAAVLLGPIATWLIVRTLPPRHPQEGPAVGTSVQAPAPVTVDGGVPSSVQSAAPVPSATTTRTAPTGTAAKPERMHIAPKASSEPADPYDIDAVKPPPAVKPLPAVTPPPAVTLAPTATSVAPPPPVAASSKVVQPTPEY